jgi:phosphoribosyl 1,2-cyclic phosphodiesterase
VGKKEAFMPARFTVLASGSAGNASLLEVDGFGVLLDAGLGPRQLAGRMTSVGVSWSHVHAVLLTHIHADHWNDRTLAHLNRRRIPLYCHPAHHAYLAANGEAFDQLQQNDLVRAYDDADWELTAAVRCQPLPLRHDGGVTFGFRFQSGDGTGSPAWSMAYVADLGSWTVELAEALTDVNLLALEFNHDVEMEYASGRSPQLIARVLGAEGHLSNDQAAALLLDVLRRSAPGRLRHVVQLHLSRDCNHRTLAVEAAEAILDGLGADVQIHTAAQDQPGPALTIGLAVEELPLSATPELFQEPPPLPPTSSSSQQWLPGWER